MFSNALKPTAPAVLSVSNVQHVYGDGEIAKPVLHGVDLEIAAGEIVILAGPSGSGKTTLLTLISGLRKLQSGSIRLFGNELFEASSDVLLQLRRRIGFVFQAHNLLPFLTARQNVELTFQLHPEVSAHDVRRRTEEMFEQLGLSGRIDAYPDRLSGGQRQRVAIARALASNPSLVLADEPTSALDGPTGRAVVNILQTLARSKGIPILMVTHDNRIFDVADRMVEMEDGRIKDHAMLL